MVFGSRPGGGGGGGGYAGGRMLSCVVRVRIGRENVRCVGRVVFRTVDNIREDMVLDWVNAKLRRLRSCLCDKYLHAIAVGLGESGKKISEVADLRSLNLARRLPHFRLRIHHTLARQ